MSVIPVRPDLVELTTLLLQPSQSFTSSSSGLTGSIRLSTKPSPALKKISAAGESSAFTETNVITSDSDDLYLASTNYQAGFTSIFPEINRYMGVVGLSDTESRQNSTTYPVRFEFPNKINEFGTGTTPVDFDENEWKILQHRVLKNNLIPDHIVENPFSQFSYVNYNSLNFVSSSNFGTASAIIFPNFANSLNVRSYSPPGAFTLDFFIKPKAPIFETDFYPAGTIFHVSSSICVSLVSGSQLGPDNKTDSFRILLQLSQSANRRPSSIDVDNLPLPSPNNLTFVSDDVLRRDSWHRVTIRWGTNTRSDGTGSIKIDQFVKTFAVNSTRVFDQKPASYGPDALILGNFYDCGDRVGKFFNLTDSAIYGTANDPFGTLTDPEGYKFTHPLNAELHHISLFRSYLTDEQLSNINALYSLDSASGGPAFFVAPFFTSSVNALTTYLTPGAVASLSTDSPISYHLSLGYNANYLNLQNFLIDFAQKKQSRALGASEGIEAPLSTYDYRESSADGILMLQTPNRRRNFSILPCDDGNFEPSFDILGSDSTRFHLYDGKTFNHIISLDNLAPPGTYMRGSEFAEFDYDGTKNVISTTPPRVFLPLFQNINYYTGMPSDIDASSNRTIFFTIPAAYYLNRITPGSFQIIDSNLSGSDGISMTLRDDGRGNIYRADARTAHAKWNRVGSIFYGHGLVAILSPHVPYFGKNGFEMSFKGEVRKTVASFSIPASPDVANNSFNQTYKAFPPTQDRTERSDDFTYITGINLHDENLNVVMRARLAQSVQKREGDEIVFRLRYDF
jgi:hypothetical protein